MEKKLTFYFDKPGDENTDHCIYIVTEAVKTFGYKYVVVASSTGETGLKFAEALHDKDIHLFIVTDSTGHEKSKHHKISDDVRKKILATGATVFTGPSIKHTLEQAFTASKIPGDKLLSVINQSFATFGEGLMACCERVMMATDGGLIPQGVETLAIAGTASGADTVAVVRATASKRFKELRVFEILAKPR